MVANAFPNPRRTAYGEISFGRSVKNRNLSGFLMQASKGGLQHCASPRTIPSSYWRSAFLATEFLVVAATGVKHCFRGDKARFSRQISAA